MSRVLSVMTACLVAAIALVYGAGPARADRIRDLQWHLPALDVPAAHRLSQGKGITVAVIDTGIKANHPDLRGNVLRGTDVVAGGNGNGWGDVDGHGTGMAGLIAAHGHGPGRSQGALGLAPKAKILPIRIATTKAGSGDSVAMANAIDYAVRRGAKIISISQRTTAEKAYDAAQRALKANVIIVAGAGNRPRDEFIGDPAAWPGVVAVGGTGKDGKVADVSTRGRALVLAAPAVDITSTGIGPGGYRIGTGTSDSTAIVSGVAALVWSRYPDLTSTQVVDHLIATAIDRGPRGRDEKYGHGVVNPVRALSTTPRFTSASPEIANNPRFIPRTTPEPAANEIDSGSSGPLGVALLMLALVAILGGGLWLFIRRRARS